MRIATIFFLATVGISSASGITLYGIHGDRGILYEISLPDASVVPIGDTRISEPLGALEFGPDGKLYAFSSAPLGASLYRIDPSTGQASSVGELGLFWLTEGGLAISPEGVAYGIGHIDLNTVSFLFTIELQTGQATVLGEIGNLNNINGLSWRSDGQLLGIDGSSNTLIALDPTHLSTTEIAVLDPPLGTVGGLTIVGDSAYFATGGESRTRPGSNGLYRLDAFTGEHSLIGTFPAEIDGSGIWGLALIPEPSAIALVAFSGILLLRRSVQRS